MLETPAQRLARWRKERNAKRKRAGRLRKLVARLNARVKKLNAAIKRATSTEVPPMVDGGWHPGATRVQVQGGIGKYLHVPAKLVWHTTEGSSLPSYSGSHPHFTLNPKTGQLWQHISIASGAMALLHPTGTVETNRAHAIQVELIGRAAETGGWPASYYERIAKLARWIEAHGGVRRDCTVGFSNTPHRLTDQGWLSYSGHLGHQHVPHNTHWDPGSFRIQEVL